ncbi:hypothetical protein [Hyphomicrobium facile]|uniref:Uncharacterized protein n=1 Tax=Hyphomicrobium facile TaxID=51670 RepID=A0A1I7MTR1_9HYPH|nr:hypothetical protein [Hyphomicrobium facile]SFV25777.1 hypothetical protein SAMN04488557_0118 [Hyphomicrobium facile]
MFKILITLAFLALPAAGTAYAQSHKDWCTDAHMEKMEAMIAKMTNSEKQKAARAHLHLSKAEMKKNNTPGCVKQMQEAHKAMGL